MRPTSSASQDIPPRLDEARTVELVREVRGWIEGPADLEARARRVAARALGCRVLEGGAVRFGFWVPGLESGAVPAGELALELFLPGEDLDLSSLERDVPSEHGFALHRLRLEPVGDYLLGVVAGLPVGSRERAGALYWLVLGDGEGRRIIRDPLLDSAPLGIYAPAEVYDMPGMFAGRRDGEYFRTWYRERLPDGSYRARDIGAHLEIHPRTATAEGTFRALTERFRAVAAKVQRNLDAGSEDPYAGLTPEEQNLVGFDTVELTPEVPTAEREEAVGGTGEFFEVLTREGGVARVRLRRPDITNWGYDTPVLGSAAVNPSLLATLRPDEFLAFVETLHTFPDRPIQLCIDSVLGHCDFQGAGLLRTYERESPSETDPRYLHSAYLRGPNMYGRDIDFREPHVKAILLELFRRKLAYGFDCVRVDGAQDFVLEMDEETGLRRQDDAFLEELANVTQEVDGITRRLDVNLEDGRPWPDDPNWLYNAKYLDHVIDRRLPFGDRVKQWSPIIFAHNVHAKYKWFHCKWDRFVEVFRYGESWITGHSNHDNARYLYRLVEPRPSSEYDGSLPFEEYYNDQLGGTLKEAAHEAMDHGALSALSLGFLPGSPMFLLNALFRTPWLFFRDIDARYDVKILAEEGSRFLDWYVDEELFAAPDAFLAVKALGFTRRRLLVAPRAEKATAPGFLDLLLARQERIRTDAGMVRFLFDDPAEGGGYASVEELADRLATLRGDGRGGPGAWLRARIEEDPLEAERRHRHARRMLERSVAYLRREHPSGCRADRTLLEAGREKAEHLLGLEAREDLLLLLYDAASRDEYDVEAWAGCAQLDACAPAAMKEGGRLTARRLRALARAFMVDSRDLCRVDRHAHRLDPRRTAYNLALRRFRQQRPWLLANPTNDVRRDYFARKLYVNGARDTGEWGDRGDLVHCDTLYYGWRTSPDLSERVFLLANMEGKPISRLPLDLFLNHPGEFCVAAATPGLAGLPATLDRTHVLAEFRNGDALLLHRRLDEADRRALGEGGAPIRSRGSASGRREGHGST